MNDSEPTSARPNGPGSLPGWLERMVHLMDEAVRVPGTRFRFGLDAVAGFLVPGLGDALANVTNVLLVVHAVRHGVPAPVLLRMGINALLDSLWAAVPLLGDIGDAWFKANRRNYALLQRYAQERRARFSDWLVVGLVFGLLTLAIALPLVLAGWALYSLLN